MFALPCPRRRARELMGRKLPVVRALAKRRCVRVLCTVAPASIGVVQCFDELAVALRAASGPRRLPAAAHLAVEPPPARRVLLYVLGECRAIGIDRRELAGALVAHPRSNRGGASADVAKLPGAGAVRPPALEGTDVLRAVGQQQRAIAVGCAAVDQCVADVERAAANRHDVARCGGTATLIALMSQEAPLRQLLGACQRF
mmetsp:Transcript_4461/g.11280  ORF Transcript_4461/g.11280 Transcript_4461/m.11280 type:complete len:201 (-) Transcript_4461:134-736(-)